MTVAELCEELTQLERNEEAPVEAYLPDLSYIVDALEQWVDLTEIAGRWRSEQRRKAAVSAMVHRRPNRAVRVRSAASWALPPRRVGVSMRRTVRGHA